MFSEFDKYMVM